MVDFSAPYFPAEQSIVVALRTRAGGFALAAPEKREARGGELQSTGDIRGF